MWKSIRFWGLFFSVSNVENRQNKRKITFEFVSNEMHGEGRKERCGRNHRRLLVHVYEAGQDGRNIPDIASKICYEFVLGQMSKTKSRSRSKLSRATRNSDTINSTKTPRTCMSCNAAIECNKQLFGSWRINLRYVHDERIKFALESLSTTENSAKHKETKIVN